MTTVTVIDYGVGNLLSVARALSQIGATPVVTDDLNLIASAQHLVLPGVGAFAHGMQGLSKRGMDKLAIAHAQAGKPLLGICLGMQMLLDESGEFGVHAGLGLISGKVSAIPNTDAQGKPHRIPHIGWNALRPPQGRDWRGTLLESTPDGACVYFVHSFAANPSHAADNLAEVDYNGLKICAAVQRDNVMGCQFHPEKSGDVGLSILKRFTELSQ
ncbi:MAG: imidazole glycerol phosphate synthase subunit HisH [Alphaproteobacteria bacterium]|nr:imidazole glycerol phosphate synthase subunit HisH [Alphaproteobacteria bacterium]